MDEIIIKVWESDEGYMYGIYDSEENCAEGNELDGGLCTTTIDNAIVMATEQARELAKGTYIAG